MSFFSSGLFRWWICQVSEEKRKRKKERKKKRKRKSSSITVEMLVVVAGHCFSFLCRCLCIGMSPLFGQQLIERLETLEFCSQFSSITRTESSEGQRRRRRRRRSGGRRRDMYRRRVRREDLRSDQKRNEMKKETVQMGMKLKSDQLTIMNRIEMSHAMEEKTNHLSNQNIEIQGKLMI